MKHTLESNRTLLCVVLLLCLLFSSSMTLCVTRTQRWILIARTRGLLRSLSSNVLSDTISCEEVIKKSRFVARLIPVRSAKQALSALSMHSDLTATHNCWAFVIRTNQGLISRSSDDGEPAGTAGRPMLTALESKSLINVLAIVTRHYGGIKLGSGGLVRAYGGVVRSAINEAEHCMSISPFIATTDFIVRLPETIPVGVVLHAISSICESFAQSQDSDSSNVLLQCTVVQSKAAEFEAKLNDVTKGSAIILQDVPSCDID